MMLRHTVALLAKDAIGIEMILEPLKASGIGREHPAEISDCKLLAGGLVLLWHG
jgi:hypothetical protein